MKKINIKKYIYKIGNKAFKTMYNKFMRVGDPRGELSMFEAQARISFYINSIIVVVLLFLIFLFVNLF